MNTSLPDGEAAFNVLFGIYSRNAMGRGFTFELSKDVFKKLTKGNCYYCNKIPSQVFNNSGQCKSQYVYNGIDRLDNSIGYVLDNCVSCCKQCNSMKSNYSYEEFVTKCKIIVETISGKQKCLTSTT